MAMAAGVSSAIASNLAYYTYSPVCLCVRVYTIPECVCVWMDGKIWKRCLATTYLGLLEHSCGCGTTMHASEGRGRLAATYCVSSIPGNSSWLTIVGLPRECA